jgi:ATP-dependent Clp protease, protease subunit
MEKPIQRKRLWELKQSVDPNVLELYIYGDIQGDYFDWMSWEAVQSETSANFFREELAKYPDVKQINVYVNSFGGSVYEAMAIRSQLKRHTALKIGCVDGFACSAASFILTACDEVHMYSNTMQFIHDAIDVCAGNARQLRKKADDLDTIMIGNRQAYLEKSGGKITEDQLKALMEAETWLTAQQCLEYGFCDKILEQEADLTAAKEMLQKVNRSLEQHLSYNKALVAQFKEYLQQSEPPEPDPVPPVDPGPDPAPGPQQNKPQKLLAALFR